MVTELFIADSGRFCRFSFTGDRGKVGAPCRLSARIKYILVAATRLRAILSKMVPGRRMVNISVGQAVQRVLWRTSEE